MVKFQQYQCFITSALFSFILVACSSHNGHKPGSINKDNERAEETLNENIQPVPATAVLSGAELKKDTLADMAAMSEAIAKPMRGRKVKASNGQVQAVIRQLESIRLPAEANDRENYADIDRNPLKRVTEQPVSTFSIDVDTGAYSNVRRFLRQGRLPPRDAVRVEELINYFNYNYSAPDKRQRPFAATTELSVSPWNSNTHLLHIGIKGYQVPRQTLPDANLVFLIDVSGSMQDANKLPLLKSALTLLSKQMTDKDRVSIVVYAGASGIVLAPTAGNETATIQAALNQLSAGGSTNGGAGIRLAYSLAQQAFIKKGINRVILATDGDFNVGTVNFEALKQLVEEQRASGITLTTLGFGTGNYNDHLMEQLADVGNGNYSYIDTLSEARKVLVDEMSSTLFTIAQDVKLQIEFNPNVVAEYRLIGYENRILNREDFANDKVDAGDIGAGHTVTALYEIALVGQGGERIAPLRYASDSKSGSSKDFELAYLNMRYKLPGEKTSKLIEHPILYKDIQQDLASSSENFRFAAAVAAFGQLLRGGKYLNDYDWSEIRDLVNTAKGQDNFGYRGEFLQLLGLAEALQLSHPAGSQG